MFDSKRLLGYKFKDEHVQNDIQGWPIKVIEDKKQVNHNMLLK